MSPAAKSRAAISVSVRSSPARTSSTPPMAETSTSSTPPSAHTGFRWVGSATRPVAMRATGGVPLDRRRQHGPRSNRRAPALVRVRVGVHHGVDADPMSAQERDDGPHHQPRTERHMAAAGHERTRRRRAAAPRPDRPRPATGATRPRAPPSTVPALTSPNPSPLGDTQMGDEQRTTGDERTQPRHPSTRSCPR